MLDSVRVLHIDDEPGFAELVSEFLERKRDGWEVITETSVADGLERLDEEPPDCIVSDYDMPDQDGIEFLEAVRETYPELPFILFTGKGSEEVASDAISSGATEYLQKESGTSQYTLLANRIENAVQQYRSRQALERERSRMEFALEATDAAVWTRDIDTDEMEIHPTVCPVFDTTIESLDEWLAQIHPRDRETAEMTIRAAARAEDSYSIQFRFPGEDGARWGEMQGRTISEDGTGSFQTGITRDITEEKEQKRRFEVLSNNLPGMVYRCRNEPSWPMEDVRGNVVQFSGYTAAELESNEVSWGEEVIHPEDQDETWRQVQEALESGESFEVTYRIRTKAGETRWVWERGRGIFGPNGELEALEGFITDITERRGRREEQRRNERRFESIFHDPNILVGLLETDGTVLQINDTAMEYVDVDREEVIGAAFRETPWWTPETSEELKGWIERAADGEYVEFEAEHPEPDGSVSTVEGVIRPVVDEDGEVVSLIVSARDITERREREEELKVVRDRMEFALARTDSVIWEQNYDTGEMVSYPDPCPVLDGSITTIDEFLERIYEDDRAAVEEAVASVLEDGKSITVEFRTTAEVEAEWVESKIQPVFDADRSVSRLIGVSRDITERKRRERKLERQNERFDELASVVSHDLQSPLSAVRGRLELAAETGELEHIQQARDAIDRLDYLREDLADMLRTREVVGERQSVDIGALAEQAWERVNKPYGSELEVVAHPMLQADPDAAQRLLQNLLSNSVEHSEGGTVVRVGELPNGFYIEDDGPGIEPKDREAVFTAGFTTKSGGSGMGMTSIKRIVDEHGWEIDISAAQTLDGVRFEITV